MSRQSLLLCAHANKIIMSMKMQLSVDTSANSPMRRLPNGKVGNQHCNATSTFCSWVGNSQTESQMMSHSLIREVMQASRAKTVLHEIHRIEEGAVLYRVPKGDQSWPHMEDSIPSRNLMYQSACYSTIKHIQERMKNSKGKSRPSSATNRQETHNKKITLSGLITYKFNSVTAKKSIGLNLINHEERMIQDKAQASNRLNCKHHRESRILAKSSLERYKKKLREEQGILADDSCSTDTYLRDIRQEKRENQLIYGQRAKKLLCVKEYMQRELVDYQVARHAIEAIEQKEPPRSKPVPPQRKVENDETVLLKRRVPHQRRAVNVHSFHFIE